MDEQYDEEFADEYDAEYDDDFDDDDESEVVSCPHCGADVYEDAERCPSCGEYVTFSTAVLADRPGWWVAAYSLGVVAVIAVLLGWAWAIW